MSQFADSPTFAKDGPDFADPIERTAIALERMSWNTPEGASSSLNRHGEKDLAYTWTRLRESDRHFWRRRATVALAAHEGWPR